MRFQALFSVAMADKPPTAASHRILPFPAGSLAAPDYAAFAKFYDHYFPRVLAFAQSGSADSAAAELLTEAILVEVLTAGLPLAPGRAADAALIEAARRVGVRDETGTNSRRSREIR